MTPYKTLEFKQKHSFGFTLLEILIAIFIFAIIVTTVFGSYNFVFSKVDAIDKGVAEYEMANNCLNRMIYDLQSMHISMYPQYSPPDFNNEQLDPYRVVGDSVHVGDKDFSRLRFVSNAHMPSRKNMQQAIAEIVYYVVENTNEDEYVLKRADNLYFNDEPFKEKTSDSILCENVKSLEFAYYDYEKTEHDFWDSESKEFKFTVPIAVSIKLELGDDLRSVIFKTTTILAVHRKPKE